MCHDMAYQLAIHLGTVHLFSHLRLIISLHLSSVIFLLLNNQNIKLTRNDDQCLPYYTHLFAPFFHMYIKLFLYLKLYYEHSYTQ